MASKSATDGWEVVGRVLAAFSRLKNSFCVRSMPSRNNSVPKMTWSGTIETSYFFTWSAGIPAVLSVTNAILPI